MDVKMEPLEAAYLAGLMDGEGCFTLVKAKAHNTPIKTQYGLRIEFVMCDSGPINLLAKLFDRPVAQKRIKSGRTAYKVVLYASNAACFTRIIYPYLRGKRDQADVCLDFWDNVAPGRGKGYTEKTVAMVEALRKDLVDLKKPHLLRC